MADVSPNSQQLSATFTRRVLIPSIAATLTAWFVQSGISLLNFPPLGGQSDFGRYVFLHWDMKVAFAMAGTVSAFCGELVDSSPKQRYLIAAFPGFFEILKWVWMLRFPLPQWIDPARQVYRFATLSIAVNVGFWLIHIIIPTAIAIGVVALLNRRAQQRIPCFETARP